ncbi:MAG: NAD-dependent epimerase/dehydratase family protein [Opitutales bacterium]|jgi:nucleoside-diphosphate-sugar epimerase
MSGKRMVIFGCGYVGRELAAAAAEAGFGVWIHSRNRESLAAVDCVPEERKVVGNLHETGWHGGLAGEWDVAVNLVSSAGGGLDGYRLSYINGNRSIREWAGRESVGRLIYTSATSVYPQSTGEWVSEKDVPETGSLSPSGQLLRQAELETLDSDVFDSVVVARLAGIYGPGRHLYLDSLRGGLRELPGDGTAWLNLVYLKDIVGVLLRMAEADLPSLRNVFNVVDDHPERKQAIVDWLSRRLGQATIPFNPDLQGPRASKRTSSVGLPNRRVSNQRLKEDLDWQPSFPSYREGYEDILGSA